MAIVVPMARKLQIGRNVLPAAAFGDMRNAEFIERRNLYTFMVRIFRMLGTVLGRLR